MSVLALQRHTLPYRDRHDIGRDWKSQYETPRGGHRAGGEQINLPSLATVSIIPTQLLLSNIFRLLALNISTPDRSGQMGDPKAARLIPQ
jgi:hypothetical protein